MVLSRDVAVTGIPVNLGEIFRDKNDPLCLIDLIISVDYRDM